MKRNGIVPRGLLLLACLGMVVPRTTLAQAPAADPARAGHTNVALKKGGLLLGQVMDRQGNTLSGAAVALRKAGKELVSLKTDAEGRFAVKGLRGGEYELVTGGSASRILAWNDGTAPPKAAAGALLVDGTAVRGQEGEMPPLPEPSDYAGDGANAAYSPDATTSYGNNGGYVTSGQPQTYYGNSGPSGRFFNGNGFLGISPWIWGAGIAAAIAIPLAVDNDDAS